MKYWLMKSEPETYSIDDLKRDANTLWEGVRNYQARNFMIDMKVGDLVLFYHSSAEPPGIAGLAVVSELAQTDRTALNPKSDHYDKKSTKENPIWKCVEVKFQEKFDRILGLEEIKSEKKLSGMLVIKRGQRLSIQPVEMPDFELILKLAKSRK